MNLTETATLPLLLLTKKPWPIHSGKEQIEKVYFLEATARKCMN